MMNPRGWRLAGAIIVVSAIALAGCGDGDNGSGANSSHGPLAEFFGWDEEWRGGDYEVTEEERQQHYDVQEYVVTCMEALGFEYHPEPFWGDDERSRDWVDPWEDVWQLQQDDPEAFAREYGYGITTINYEDREDPNQEWDPSDDPNWEYRESLSPAAQEEYEKALWGDWSEYEEEYDEDGEYIGGSEPYEAGGCMNEAYDDIYGWNDDEGNQFEELWEKWDRLYEDIQNDARLVDANRAWADCMSAAGYSGLSDRWDAQNEVYDRQSELYGWDTGDGGPRAEVRVEGEEIEDYEPVEPDPADLADLRAFELAIAWADFECKREHDVEQVEREVTFEHEERFIEENREELEVYRDWQNERGY